MRCMRIDYFTSGYICFSLSEKDSQRLDQVYLEPKENTFLAHCIVIERVGKDTILTLNWKNQILKIIVEKDFKLQHKSDNIWFEINMDKLYFLTKILKNCYK